MQPEIPQYNQWLMSTLSVQRRHKSPHKIARTSTYHRVRGKIILQRARKPRDMGSSLAACIIWREMDFIYSAFGALSASTLRSSRQTILFPPSLSLSRAPTGWPSYVGSVRKYFGDGEVVAVAEHVNMRAAWVRIGLA
jgi:hypothetical protein